jgi:hypothetical protein
MPGVIFQILEYWGWAKLTFPQGQFSRLWKIGNTENAMGKDRKELLPPTNGEWLFEYIRRLHADAVTKNAVDAVAKTILTKDFLIQQYVNSFSRFCFALQRVKYDIGNSSFTSDMQHIFMGNPIARHCYDIDWPYIKIFDINLAMGDASLGQLRKIEIHSDTTQGSLYVAPDSFDRGKFVSVDAGKYSVRIDDGTNFLSFDDLKMHLNTDTAMAFMDLLPSITKANDKPEKTVTIVKPDKYWGMNKADYFNAYFEIIKTVSDIIIKGDYIPNKCTILYSPFLSYYEQKTKRWSFPMMFADEEGLRFFNLFELYMMIDVLNEMIKRPIVKDFLDANDDSRHGFGKEGSVAPTHKEIIELGFNKGSKKAYFRVLSEKFNLAFRMQEWANNKVAMDPDDALVSLKRHTVKLDCKNCKFEIDGNSYWGELSDIQRKFMQKLEITRHNANFIKYIKKDDKVEGYDSKASGIVREIRRKFKRNFDFKIVCDTVRGHGYILSSTVTGPQIKRNLDLNIVPRRASGPIEYFGNKSKRGMPSKNTRDADYSDVRTLSDDR